MTKKLKEQLVSQELYDLLKEKGYDIPDKQNECPSDMLINKSGDYLSYVLPTLSLVQKWLREVHNIHIQVEYSYEQNNQYGSFVYKNGVDKVQHELNILELDDLTMYYEYETYDIALENGLIEALNLI